MDEKELEKLRAELKMASERWQCLITNAFEMAKAQKSDVLDYGKVQAILYKCEVPQGDHQYYMDIIMHCHEKRSW